MTWMSSTFRDALGFTGDETAVSSDGVYTLTGTYPARGVLVIRSGLAILNPVVRNYGFAHSQLSGRMSSRKVTTFKEIQVSATLRGGVGLSESRSAYEDEAEIY